MQWFYIYLFGVSTLFLLYAYTCLFREPEFPQVSTGSKQVDVAAAAAAADTQDPLISKSASRIRLAVESHSHTGSFFLRLGAVGESQSHGQLFPAFRRRR